MSTLLYRNAHLTRGMFFKNLYCTASLRQLGKILPYRPNQFHTYYQPFPSTLPFYHDPLLLFLFLSILEIGVEGGYTGGGQGSTSLFIQCTMYRPSEQTDLTECTGLTSLMLSDFLPVDNIGMIKQLCNQQCQPIDFKLEISGS